MKRITSTILGSSLLLWAGVASAVAEGAHDIDTTSANATSIIGSDTLNKVMDDLFIALAPSLSGTGYTNYLGLGSSVGERQLAGSPNAGEPTCTPNDSNGGAEGNPGCEEISPMSRPLQSGICDDDHDNVAGAGGWTGTNTLAEGMAICGDGIVIITDNTSLGQYGNDGAGGAPNCGTYSPASTDNTGNTYPDLGVGDLRDTGTVDLAPLSDPAGDYTIGAAPFSGTSAWKDVVRIVYTGCDNTDGTCAGANDRVARCNSELRNKVISDWGILFEGTDCGSPGNNCPNGLRKAYRRDDGSGTTGAFLELIGVAFGGGNLASRTTVFSGSLTHTITAIPNNLSFCDGGQVEGFFPTNLAPDGTALFELGDPIRKNCAPEDDLCAYDGKMPIVRSIRSTVTPDPLDPLSGYPTHQCNKGLFAKKNFLNTSLKVCPDGTKPSSGQCKFPYFRNPDLSRNFNCLNQAASRPSTVPSSTDGRSYNYVMHLTDGTVRFAAAGLPQVASWRENMAVVNTGFGANNGFAFGPPPALGDYVCTESDATRNIGCLVGKTTCTVGFAGREAAFNTGSSHHLAQEPVKLGGFSPTNANINSGAYGFARDLFINATHGFENLTEDCEGRGGTAAQCADELLIANTFYNLGAPGNPVAGICSNAGFIPKTEIRCDGAAITAGCGAPAVQSKTDCLPQ